MTNKLLLAAATVVLLFSACRDNNTETAKVDLNFRANFGDAPLTMFTRSYPYREGMNVKFQNFLFYISDVTLLREDGSEHKLTEVELLSFRNIQDDNAADQGISTASANVPVGNYTGIRMGVGIAPALNGTQPGDYKAGHPLTDNYWSWALGYIFTKIEGNADLDGDGNYDENAKLTFHIGANELYRTRTFSKAIEVKSGQPLSIPFKVDLESVLVKSDGNFLDFRVTRQDHTNDMDVARFIMDNLADAIQLRTQ